MLCYKQVKFLVATVDIYFLLILSIYGVVLQESGDLASWRRPVFVCR